jgi:hypothetical protein
MSISRDKRFCADCPKHYFMMGGKKIIEYAFLPPDFGGR